MIKITEGIKEKIRDAERIAEIADAAIAAMTSND